MGKKYTKHLQIGQMGENIACEFLKNKGFLIVETNARQKWGGLDIVSKNKKTGITHIVEVKTVRGAKGATLVSPSENLTRAKLEKLERAAILYCQENCIQDWQLDMVLVWLDEDNRKAEIRHEQIF